MTAQSPTLLLVDDDELLRTSLATMLEAAGYTVHTASDGDEGAAKALELHPALVMVDYQMPRMNGLEAIKQLRADPWGATVPIIFATNVYDINIINTLLSLNVGDYLLKNDVTLDDIQAQIRKYVPI